MPEPITPITDDECQQTAARLTIAPMLEPDDGSVWAFNGTGYTQIVEPWAVEAHILPVKRKETLGDVDSWVAYVQRFAGLGEYAPLLLWSPSGLTAILDYHTAKSANRCQWEAVQPFVHTVQWRRWSELANGRARGQREVIEALEDNAEDIVSPSAADVVGLLKALRGTVNKTADSTLNEDGSTHVSFEKSTTIRTATEATIPSEIEIAVPIFKGHPERFKLKVRVRVSVDDSARLAFRLSMPSAEAALEIATADRVQAARNLLGDDYTLLRSAGGSLP